MIEEYKFGSITIDGKVYNGDIEARWNGEVFSWWRDNSHFVDIDDIKRAAEQNPDTIIIGTGESNLVKISEETKNFIIEKGIKLIIDKTEEAVKTFNVICNESEEEEGRQNKAIGLFHLTC